MSETSGAVEVEIHGISSEGAGVGRLPDGKVVFVHRTAPGDRARVRVTENRKSWARGALAELVEPGPGRRDAPCPGYGRCGGCTLEHLEYGVQLRAKGRMVADALERIGGIAIETPEVRPSPDEFRYRSRVTFTLRRREGRVVAGFHALEEPAAVVDMGGECLLPVEAVAAAWDSLRESWGPDARRLPSGSELRLTLRAVADGVVLVIRGGRGRGRPRELLDRVEGLQAVWMEKDGDAVLLAGRDDLRERWLGEEPRVSGAAFLQVNRAAAEEVHRHVLAWVTSPGERRVVDAYCGVGLYGRALAREGAEVVGIELDSWAASSAREAAPEGFRVLEGRVSERLDEALPADLVILNPPRSGLEDEVPGILVADPPRELIYMSCDQATLARDLKRLAPAYALREIQAFDLFPQTAHVEVVAVLDRVEGPSDPPLRGGG